MCVRACVCVSVCMCVCIWESRYHDESLRSMQCQHDRETYAKTNNFGTSTWSQKVFDETSAKQTVAVHTLCSGPYCAASPRKRCQASKHKLRAETYPNIVQHAEKQRCLSRQHAEKQRCLSRQHAEDNPRQRQRNK